MLIARVYPGSAETSLEKAPFRERMASLIHLIPPALIFIVTMGAIYFGWATPTEAAGVGVIATIILGKLWGSLTFRKLVEAIFSATLLYASIMFVVIGATILAQAVSLLGIPQSILETVRQTSLGPDFH